MKSLMLSLVAASLLTGLAAAQTGPIGPVNPAPGPMINPQPVAAAQGLSEDAIHDLLKKFDANVQVKQQKDGRTFLAHITKDGWRFEITVDTFPNRVLFNCNVTGYMSESQLSPQTAFNLLFTTGSKLSVPTHFAMHRDNQGKVMVVLSRFVDRIVPATSLENHLNQFLNDIRISSDVWLPLAQAVPPTAIKL